MKVKSKQQGPGRRARQRGLSLLGLMLYAILFGVVGYVLVRALPTVNEYMTIQSAIKRFPEDFKKWLTKNTNGN